MRILHILDHSIPLHSGYSFRTLAILKEQRALGWKTFHLTSPKHNLSAPPCEKIDGWEFFRTTLPSDFVSRLPILDQLASVRATTRRLAGLANEIRPDILHAHSPVLNAISALHVGRRLAIPVVYEIRGFWEDAAASHGTSPSGGPRYRLTRALETYAVKRVHAVTTICEGLRNDLLSRGLPPKKIAVVPNGVDLSTFSGTSSRDPVLVEKLGLSGAAVLGFIGSFYSYEGLQVLIRALPAIRSEVPDTRLLLVGGGPAESSLERLADTLGLANVVVFAGRVDHDQVRRYYDLIDLFVYPRLSMRLTETVTPLKPLEAMAQGKIVMASDVGGHRELIRDEETGYLFAADDPSSLAACAIDVLRRRDSWREMRLRARSYVQHERTWKASVAGYREVYSRVLSS